MWVGKSRIIGFLAWCLAAGALLFVPRQATGAGAEPIQFDYQERTGYPLAFEERVVPLAEADALVEQALARSSVVVGNKTLADWREIKARLDRDAPDARKAIRVVRLFSDQAVYIKDGFALLPDPSKPDQPVSPADFDINVDCDPTSGSIKANRCIALHRDHEQNRAVIGVLLAARTIIVEGTNKTGGLSLLTITENLRMNAGAHLDLSARQDRAPTFGVGQDYQLYAPLVGSPGLSVELDVTAVKDPGEPSATNPWLFEDHPDLQWQMDRAREAATDYVWSPDLCFRRALQTCGENCEASGKDAELVDGLIELCYREREPRGLAGLPGGHWLALTYRTNTVRATSNGQPGGNGGPGLDHTLDTKCNAPPVQRKCGFIGSTCNGVDDPPNNPSCGVPSDSPPSPQDVCSCSACGATQCSENYGEESPNEQGCVVACEVNPLARGYRGGQAAEGGLWGLIRIWATVRNSSCDFDYSEANLRDPLLAHRADERCMNNQPDEHDPESLVDCESEMCSRDPNVTVCPAESQRHGGGLGIRPITSTDLVNKLSDYIQQHLVDHKIDLLPFNPVRHVDPDIFMSGKGNSLLHLDDRLTAVLETVEGSLVPKLVDVVERPAWAPVDRVQLPSALWNNSVTFEDERGALAFPSLDAERIVTRLLGSSAGPAANGGSTASVVGFESVGEWASTAEGLSVSSDATQGSASLSVAAAGWQELTSAAIRSPGAVGSAISFDIKLPAQAVNEWWAGDVSLVLDAPSAGIYSAWVGQQPLQGLPLGAFQRVSFALTSDLVSRLSLSYSDLRIKLTLNVPSGPGHYLLDNLSFSGNEPPAAAPPPPAMVFSLSLPRGFDVGNVALGATASLRIADGAAVRTTAGGLASVVNTGGDQTNIGVDAQTGSIASVASVVLRDRAQVTGAVASGGSITLHPGAAVSGTQLGQQNLSPFRTLSWSQQPEAGAASILLEPDQQGAIDPGSYAAVTIRSRSTLTLSTGTFFMDSLTVEPQARLLLDTSDGPVVFVIRSAFTFRGALAGAEPESVLIAYAGVAPVAIESTLGATVVAPAASLRYATGSTSHSGAAFAKAIEIDPGITFEHRPFAFWSLMGAEGGNDRFSQMASYVRSTVAQANLFQFRDQPVSSRAVLELAKLSASSSFREVLRSVLATGRLKTPADLRGDELPFLQWYRKAGDLQDRLAIGYRDLLTDISTFSPSTMPQICEDDASGARFGKPKAGESGTPGTGGSAPDPKRCLGFAPTFDKVCVHAPVVPNGTCTYENAPGQCPYDCEERLFFPADGQPCPAGYALRDVPKIFGLPFVCPSQVEPGIGNSGGNVDCSVSPGATGADVFAAPTASTVDPPNRVGTWSYSDWAVTTHRLQPGEISRRVGRANTFYKRDERIAASARYLSARTMAQANYVALHNTGITCALNLGSCPVCPADPNELGSDEQKRICALVGETNGKLRQLMFNANYYGYTPNFVPPASARLHDPAALFDLLSLVTNELETADAERKFWLRFGAILNGNFRDSVEDARADLGLQQAFLADAVDPQGSLGLEMGVANSRVRALAAQLQVIHAKLKALNITKAQLQSGGSFFDIDVMELFGIVASAAATAYGGPAAGAAVTFLWASIDAGLSSDDAAAQLGQQRTSGPGATVIAKNGCVVATQDSKKLPTGDECWDKFKEQAVKGIVESETVKSLVDNFLTALHLKDPPAPDATRLLIVDSAIADLAIEAIDVAGELGGALQATTIVEERYREGLRQLARIAAAKTTLNQVPVSGFPAPEVQLALADLSFQSGAAAVDRAGEHFFLYRRGVERDVLPVDPVTGESTLTKGERTFMLQQAECAGIGAASLDINFSSLPCFQRRTSFLTQAAAVAHGARSIDSLEVSDTAVPFSQWHLGTDVDGDEAYSFSLAIDVAKAQRGSRGSGVGELKQAIRDISFFLETNDPTPAPLRLKVKRPTTSPDLFYIGKLNGVRQYQFFDVARGGGAVPETPLFELLRDNASYERFGFACNGLNENADLSGGFAKCKLSNLTEQERAFLVERSLIGTLDFSLKLQDLGGRTPVRFFALVDYYYAIQPQ